MKTYWDSSALVEAIHNEELWNRFKTGAHVTRSHSLVEMFSTLSGGRMAIRYSPSDAAGLVASIAQELDTVDLTPEEVLDGLAEASGRGVRGGRVHDWMHALAAEKAGADTLLTLNQGDFQGLERGFELAAT